MRTPKRIEITKALPGSASSELLARLVSKSFDVDRTPGLPMSGIGKGGKGSVPVSAYDMFTEVTPNPDDGLLDASLHHWLRSGRQSCKVEVPFDCYRVVA